MSTYDDDVVDLCGLLFLVALVALDFCSECGYTSILELAGEAEAAREDEKGRRKRTKSQRMKSRSRDQGEG